MEYLWGVCCSFVYSIDTQTIQRVDRVVDEPCIRDEFNSTVFVEIGTQDGGLKRAIYNIRLLLLPVVALQV